MADAFELVQLNLISPTYVEPIPNKENFGRFDKVLRSVGSPRTVHVRPRMITVVSETKYSTKSGFPISLIGLHGKDELLVVGPAWALLKLASGQKVKEPPLETTYVEYQKALQTIIAEVFWLLRVRALLDISLGAAYDANVLSQADDHCPPEAAHFLQDPLWPQMGNEIAAEEESREFLQLAATDLLQGMFRCSIGAAQQYFSDIDTTGFIQTCIQECVDRHREMSMEAEEYSDTHAKWWGEWEDKAERYALMPNFLAASGRNITAYPTKPDSLLEARPRRYSMHEKWKSAVKKYHESILPVQISAQTN